MNRRLLALLAAMSLVFAGAVGATTAGAAPQAPSPIAAYSPGTITGTVTRAGQVLAGAEVVIWTYDGRHIADLVTDAAGSYTTGVLTAGSYRVGVLPPAGGTFFSTYYGDTVRTSDVTPVKVTATGPQVADIAVKYGGSITGTVLNARGKAMAGIWVRATATARLSTGPSFPHPSRSRPAGRRRFPPSGSSRRRARHPSSSAESPGR